MNILLLMGIIIIEVICIRGAKYGYDEDEIKNKFVTEITKKIEIIADTLSLASADDRPKLLFQLEGKLRTAAAQSFGNDSDKYVDFIMKGIKMKAFHDNRNTSEIDKDVSVKSNEGNDSGERIVKDRVVRKITGQIESFVKKYLLTVRSFQDKRIFLENVRRKMVEIAKAKHFDTLNGDISSYSNIITNSLNDILNKTLQQNSESNVGAKKENEIKEYNDELIYGNASVYRRVFNNNEEILDFNEKCIMSTALLCSEVNSLSESICSGGGKIISVKDICNNIEDCTDGSDEINCKDQVANILNKAKNFLLEMHAAQEENCQMQKTNWTFPKSDMIYDSIQDEITIINDQQNSFHVNNNSEDLQEVMNNMVNNLDKITLSLNNGICARQKNTSKLIANARRFQQILGEDLEEVLRESALFPKSCVCNDDHCISKTCVKSCKNACLLKYRLGRWSCPAVNGESSIALDVICDGKFDCYDESDELDCSRGKGRGKFQANEGFLQITKILEMKMASKENEPVRNELLRLYMSVIKLQNLITAREPHAEDVRTMRDRSFMLLSLIYGNYMRNTYNSNNAEEMYRFLNAINRILVTALKVSNTGNTRVISTYNCFCRKDKCFTPVCSLRCIRVCTVENKLTRYHCLDSRENSSIPLELMCNGRNNCPKKDDEVNCSEDVCRRHHLYSLRLTIQDIGREYDRTSFGAIVNFWRMKATSSLLIAENIARPTIMFFRKTLKDLLQDLVYAYASLDSNKSTVTERAFQAFFEISQKVMDAWRSCGN